MYGFIRNGEANNQERVYKNVCKWWRKADEITRETFVATAASPVRVMVDPSLSRAQAGYLAGFHDTKLGDLPEN